MSSLFTLVWFALLCHCQLFLFLRVDGFQTIRSTCMVRNVPRFTDHRQNTSKNGRTIGCFSAAGGIGDDNLVALASEKLDWEIAEETSRKPVLNLSIRDASPEETTTDESDDNDVCEWNRGQRWTVTLKHLTELGVTVNEASASSDDTSNTGSVFLENCPQLFRLDPSEVRETAQWIVDEFGLSYLKAAAIQNKNSVLLSFRKEDAAYGLEFMTTMMMMDAKPACAASSALLLQAIRGGIQERAVGAALRAAENATSQASKSIASDTMESLRQVRDATRNKI